MSDEFSNGPTKSLSMLRTPPNAMRGRIIETMLQSASSGFDPDMWVVMDQRDNALIEDELLHGVSSAAFIYKFPQDGGEVSGISVIGARELASHYQGIKHKIVSTTSKVGPLFVTQSYDPPRAPHVEVIPQLDDVPDYFEVVCEVTDVKTGNSIQETVKEGRMERRSRAALQRNPGMAEEFERKHYEKIAASKAYRNGVLHLIPQSVQLQWKALMLKAGKAEVVSGSLLDEKRSGVLRYAASKAIGVDRRAIEALTLDQISGLSDAAREGKESGFIAAAEALGITAQRAIQTEAQSEERTQPKRQAKRTKADDAPPADEPEPPKDNDMVRALQLVDDLAKVKYQHEYDEVINAAIRSWARRMAETRPDIKAIVENADKAAVERIKQKEPPPSDGPPWEELGAPPE